MAAKTFTTILIILILCFTSVFFVPKVKANPGYEDFTSFIKVDPGDHINITANHIDHDAWYDEHARLWKDYGVGYFTDFEHLIDVRQVSRTGSASIAEWPWVLSNNNGNYANNYPLITIMLYWHGATGPAIYLREHTSGGVDQQSYSSTANVWKYLTINKTGTALTCKIYSDSGRSNLLATLSVTLDSDYSFRYLLTAQTHDAGLAYYQIIDVANLDLQITVFSVTFYNNTGGILRVNNATVANGTEIVYANNTQIELIAIVQGNLTYGFGNFTWDSSYNISNPYDWTIVYGVSNLTLWCYFGSIGAAVEERAFGTLGFVVAVIALAIGVVVLAGKKIL